MRTTIYALCDPVTHEPRYIGKTVRALKARLRQHCIDSRTREQTYKGNWIRSLPTPPLIQSLAVCTGDNALASEAERTIIALYRATGRRLVNTTDGGDGAAGRKQSPEERAKRSRSLLGKKKSPEHCAANAAAHVGLPKNPNSGSKRGVKFSEAAKANMAVAKQALLDDPIRYAAWRTKIGAAHRGRVRSAEHCAKISAAHLGRPLSAETRAKMSASHMGKPSGMRGRTRSPEACAKTSASLRAHWQRRLRHERV